MLDSDGALSYPLLRREDLRSPCLVSASRALQVQVKSAQTRDSAAWTVAPPTSLPPRPTVASALGPQPRPVP